VTEAADGKITREREREGRRSVVLQPPLSKTDDVDPAVLFECFSLQLCTLPVLCVAWVVSLLFDTWMAAKSVVSDKHAALR
jgi:hypothetical protein